MQDVPTNFDTDLLSPIIVETMALAKLDKTDTDGTVALRVIADHLRCAAFMIADGVLPSNSKRGYVVRRIIRRAFRFGRALGLIEPFLWKLVPNLDEVMGGHYHELRDNARFIADTLRAEEKRFAGTLERGEELLAELISKARAAGAKELNGADVFTLYDTYGFPRELTAETALEAGLAIDEEGFKAAMDAARERARAGGKFGYETAAQLGAEMPATAFTGYVTTETEATLLHFEANADRTYATVVLDKTPFYATSGGQCADTGTLCFDSVALPVVDAQKDKFGHVLHTVALEGHEEFEPGPHHTVTATVDSTRRQAIRRAHSSTHLLHWALHVVLGEHAKQAGSLVEEDYFRFDFSHPRALTQEEIRQVEELVYGKILDDESVVVRDMTLEEARKEGYTALFGEKYGEWVRTVNIGGDHDVTFSRELCGGTHLDRTGQAGFFKIVAESSVAAGIRRIEAVTGRKAADWAREQAGIVRELALAMKVPAEDVLGRVDGLQKTIREQEARINELKVQAAAGGGMAGPKTEEIAGLRVLVSALDGLDAATLGNLADEYLGQDAADVIVLASATDGKALFAVKVKKGFTDRANAGNIVREMAKLAGGGGGGRPDFAQAGGKDAGKIPEALAKAREMIAG